MSDVDRQLLDPCLSTNSRAVTQEQGCRRIPRADNPADTKFGQANSRPAEEEAMRSGGTLAEPTYSSYLQIGRLLDLQRPLSTPEHHDELHFIVTHQAMELWFKVMIHELNRVQQYLADQSWTQAVTKMRRVNAILTAQTAQLDTLTTLDPQAFMGFRRFLGSASGFQSIQFRALELLGGIRDPAYLNQLRHSYDGHLPPLLAKMAAAPSLAETASGAPEAAGVRDWCDVYADPNCHGQLFLIGEELIEYDRRWIIWRQAHMLLVEQIIGPGQRGTGGRSTRYLQHNAHRRHFPFIWEVRNRIAEANGSPGEPRLL
jgi:tryptophan 2,3-dioxygenase